MKTIIILHHDSIFDKDLLAPWLNSFTDLKGVVIIEESKNIVKKRIKNELKRSGVFSFLDILLFRVYYKLFQQTKDTQFINDIIKNFNYNKVNGIDICKSQSVNSSEVFDFLKEKEVDFVLARSKQLIRKEIYSVPKYGIYVIHTGITPEYRNAYGLFWAIYNRDYNKVGSTLLKIDDGIDTGPIYEYYRHEWDFKKESVTKMQINSIYLNLDKIKSKFLQIENNEAIPLDIPKIKSKLYGQIHFTKYLKVLMRYL